MALFDKSTTTIGPIALLICNAAVNPEITLLQTSDPEKHWLIHAQVCYNYLADEIDREESGQLERPSTQLFDINVNSVVFGLKLGIHHMKHQGGDQIVIVGSAGSTCQFPHSHFTQPASMQCWV